jgi:hypothetical protein
MAWFENALEIVEGLLKIGLLILVSVSVVGGCWCYHQETRRSAYMQAVDTVAEFVHAASYSVGSSIIVCHYGTHVEMLEFEHEIKREGITESDQSNYFLNSRSIYQVDGYHVTKARVDPSCPDDFYYELIYNEKGLRIIKEISKRKYLRIVQRARATNS